MKAVLRRTACQLVYWAARGIMVLAVVHSLMLQNAQAEVADFGADRYRVGVATERFDDAWQAEAAWDFRAPRRLRARRLELATGLIVTPDDTQGFVSLGPVWRLPTNAERAYIEFGFAPTLLTGSRIGEHDMGGVVHFTSSAEVGVTLDPQRRAHLALRVKHISNGGLHSNNPSMDVVGLSFTYDLPFAYRF